MEMFDVIIAMMMGMLVGMAVGPIMMKKITEWKKSRIVNEMLKEISKSKKEELVETIPARQTSESYQMQIKQVHYQDYAILALRVLLGSVFILGGIKLLLLSPEAAVELLTPTGFVKREIAVFIPNALSFVVTIGIIELMVGSLTIVGFKTKYVSIAGALLFLLFIVAQQNLGYSKLFLDVTLKGMYIALALVGSGKYSIDKLLGTNYQGFAKQTPWFHVILRANLSFAFFMTIFFPNFASDGLQFIPLSLSIILGSLLLVGLPNRTGSIAATIVLIFVAFMNLTDETILDTKHAIGLIGGSTALSIMGVGAYSISNLFRNKIISTL